MQEKKQGNRQEGTEKSSMELVKKVRKKSHREVLEKVCEKRRKHKGKCPCKKLARNEVRKLARMVART